MYILDGIEDLEVLSKEQTNYYLKKELKKMMRMREKY